MPSAPAPFVSFNDYLDANAGSLQQERGDVLGSADASLADMSKLVDTAKTAAYGQGADAAKAAWGAQRSDQSQHITSSEQYKPPTDFSVNFSTLPGQEQFAKDKATAETQLSAMQQGGLGSGKSAFEAGMIGADTSFKDAAAAKQKSYQDQVNGYLDSIKGAGQAGLASFKPAPIVTYQSTFDPGGGGGGEGPYQKPRRTGTRRLENGQPVGGRGDYEP